MTYSMLDFLKKTYPPKGDRSKNQMKTIQGGKHKYYAYFSKNYC